MNHHAHHALQVVDYHGTKGGKHGTRPRAHKIVPGYPVVLRKSLAQLIPVPTVHPGSHRQPQIAQTVIVTHTVFDHHPHSLHASKHHVFMRIGCGLRRCELLLLFGKGGLLHRFG
ncbi:ORF41 [Fowl aviadenovirus 4]|uniref:ORF41 n=1 Tax=Fowl aviadenovirus 4 TaxID=130663 RepID=A0A7G3VX83_FADV4|nr:ORF41 [Fowl aviadenovirus 4]